MGIADWLESLLLKTVLLLLAVLSLLKPMDMTESEQQESASKFIIQQNCVAFFLGMVWHIALTSPFPSQTILSSPLIEEASARSYNKYIIALPRSGSTGEYSVLSFCIGLPYGRANTASLELNILLYCPPTRAIIYIYVLPDLRRAVMRPTTNFFNQRVWQYLGTEIVATTNHLRRQARIIKLPCCPPSLIWIGFREKEQLVTASALFGNYDSTQSVMPIPIMWQAEYGKIFGSATQNSLNLLNY